MLKRFKFAIGLVLVITVLGSLYFFKKAGSQDLALKTLSENSIGLNTLSLASTKTAAAGGTTSNYEASTEVQILEEILISRSDNDPRLDTDLRVLNDQTKEIFRQKYKLLEPEERNGRGTIVFLLGRNLKTPDDFRFLKEVVSEEPCLSLLDCHTSPAHLLAGNEAPEHTAGSAITLAYPQLVALHSIEKVFQKSSIDSLDETIRKEALEVINAAKNSKSSEVIQMASKIESKIYR